MTINGKVGSFTRNEERAGVPGHGPVILAGLVAAAAGVYATGLLLTRSLANILAPLAVIAAEVLGAGDGATKDFTGNLAAGQPVEPGTVVVTDGVETFADDGSGRLVGDAGGSGTVNYKTGAIAVSFNANVVDQTDVTVDYITAIDGVLDEEIDTAESQACLYVGHGTVDSNVLKVGQDDQAEPSAALLMLLQKHGIYPK